jgi:hypothetical protein
MKSFFKGTSEGESAADYIVRDGKHKAALQKMLLTHAGAIPNAANLGFSKKKW